MYYRSSLHSPFVSVLSHVLLFLAYALWNLSTMVTAQCMARSGVITLWLARHGFILLLMRGMQGSEVSEARCVVYEVFGVWCNV